MRSLQVVKFLALLLLLAGGTVISAQADNLPIKFNILGNACNSRATTLGESPVSDQAFAPAMGSSTATMAGSGQLAHTAAIRLNGTYGAHSVAAASDLWACDGLKASIVNNTLSFDPHKESAGVHETLGVYSDKPTVIPLPAAAWLFSFALLGFVVVANRRKV